MFKGTNSPLPKQECVTMVVHVLAELQFWNKGNDVDRDLLTQLISGRAGPRTLDRWCPVLCAFSTSQ